MFLRRGVIFALDAIIHALETPGGYSWTFDPRLPGWLRDCRATGHRLFGLLDPSVYGLVLESDDERHELVAYINDMLQRADAPALDAIHVTEDIADPQPLWAWRRQFGFSLRASTIIGLGPKYEQLRRNAGIEGSYLEPRTADDLFGANPAFVF